MDKKSIVSIIDQYFQRFPFRKIEINDPISLDLKIIVVIPVYNEDAIEDTLKSIFLPVDFDFNLILNFFPQILVPATPKVMLSVILGANVCSGGIYILCCVEG